MTRCYTRAVSVFVRSKRRGLLLLHQLAPGPQPVTAAPRITLAPGLGGRHAVGAKGAIRAPQFAPGHDHPHLIEKAQRQGPNQPLALSLARIGVIDMQFGLIANGFAKHIERDAVFRVAEPWRAR